MITKIWAIFDGMPSIPPSAQSPTAKRITWASPNGKTYTVDYDGDAPTGEQIRQIAEPSQAEIDADRKAGEKLALRGPQMRAVRVALKAIVKKMPAYNWQQFLADFDAAMDAEPTN